MNIIDKAVAIFSPQAALRRVHARAQIELFGRSYDGAARGRHVKGWNVSSTSADAEIATGGRILRDRARDLDRNNPLAAKAAALLVQNIIGEGIMPSPKEERVMAAFEAWSKRCDADGQLDFYGLQCLSVRGMVTGGEMLARRVRLPKAAERVPLHIRVMEPDHLDDFRHGRMPNGPLLMQGIEFDTKGRRAAYWLYDEHPGNEIVTQLASKRVPATEITHLYEKQRQQSRGVPWAAPVVRRMRDADDYDFAEILRKKIEASSVAFVTGDDTGDALTGLNGQPASPVTDSRGNIVESFEPGLIMHLRPGRDVKFNTPHPTAGYEEFKRVSGREIAAGMRVPYAMLTGDSSQENFSAQRGQINEFRRFCAMVQWQIVVPMFLDPVWSWWTEAAYLAGVIDDRAPEANWKMPKLAAIDPYKDALADVMLLRSGIRSYPDLVAERGYHWMKVLGEVAEFNAAADAAGIILDSDPRRVTNAGVYQKDVTANGTE
jgi:lambda family phage portal protein